MFSLHTEALCWLRFAKRMPVVCTEVGYWNADVIGMNASMCIEVEIKHSMSDLRADFKNKPHKHFVYGQAGDFDPRTTSGSVPNYFYFMVPEEMAEKAQAFIAEKAPKAGLAVRLKETNSRYYAGKFTHVKIRPKQLHNRPPSPALLRAAVMRMASEICGHRLSLDLMGKSEMTMEVIRAIQQAVVSMDGALDFEDYVSDIERRGAELAWAVESLKWEDLDHVARIRWMFAARKLLDMNRNRDKDLRHETIC